MDSVLVVDDDSFVRGILEKILNVKYAVLTAASGQEAIEIAVKKSPQTILLDVEMPGMNGYETCDMLKCNPKTKSIPVLFISGKSSVRERLQGYESGGEDYIVKPPESDVLLAKVSVSIKNYLRLCELGDTASAANDMAYTALKSQGDMGTVIQFIEQVGIIPSYEILAQKLLDSCSYFGLSAVVGMNTHEEDNRFFSTQGTPSELEREIIELKSKDHRFVDFGRRTLINYSRISLLIKNMPLDDMALYGRIKDLFPPIMASSNAHLISLINRYSIRDVNSLVTQSVQVIDERLTELKSSIGFAVRDFVRSSKEDYFSMEQQLIRLGLEHDQEEFIMEMFTENLSRSALLLGTQEELSAAFEKISKLLHIVEVKQDDLQQLASETVLASEAEVMSALDDDVEEDGVELF